MEEDTFKIGVKHQVFNNEVRKRRKNLGLSQKDLSLLVGRASTYISQIECFQRFPEEREAQLLADILETTVSQLFPKWLEIYKLKQSSTITEHEVTPSMLQEGMSQFLLGGSNEPTIIIEEIDQEQLAKISREQLGTLTERERITLMARFGFYDGERKTLKEVGEHFGVSSNRIRQIEAKAIHKLRHPTRADKLQPYF